MSLNLPAGFHSEFHQCGEVRLHIVHNSEKTLHTLADDPRPAILMLHGFPEFWIAWREVFLHLSDNFVIIAPDQRGYNLSDGPKGLEHYRAKLLVHDMMALADSLLGVRKFTVAGHDWGASVAYALAMRAPDRVSHLVIANGVHPVCFQEAILDDPKQAEASGYIHILRRPDAARIMAENQFQRTFGMFEKFSATPWLTEDIRKEYLDAWSQPNRLESMLHWYNSSPIAIPTQDETPEAMLYGASRENFRISMPHLLVWGQRDQALLGSATKDLGQFCDALTRFDIPDADHWLLHTHGALIAEHIRNFISD